MKGNWRNWRLLAGSIFVLGALAFMTGAAAIVQANTVQPGIPAVPPTSPTSQTIVSITAMCGTTNITGTLTVSDPVAGDTVTLGLFSHTPGSSVFVDSGNHVTITMVAGQTTYSYSITSVVINGANTLRVQVVSTSPAGAFNGTTEKSDSFGPCGAVPTPTPPVPTPTPPVPTPTPPVPTPTPPVPTPTPPVPTPTPPVPTPTPPVPTPTPVVTPTPTPVPTPPAAGGAPLPSPTPTGGVLAETGANAPGEGLGVMLMLIGILGMLAGVFTWRRQRV